MEKQSTAVEGDRGHYLQKVDLKEEAGLLLQVQMKTIQNTDGSPDQFL